MLQTLDTMDAQTTDGAAWLAQRSVTADDARPLDDLADWVAGQSDGLSALTGEMPEAARSAFDDSLRLLTEIGTRTDGLRTALDCSAGPATTGSDELGPVPAACPPAPAAGAAMSGPTAGIGSGSGGTPPSGPTADVPGGTSGGTSSVDQLGVARLEVDRLRRAPAAPREAPRGSRQQPMPSGRRVTKPAGTPAADLPNAVPDRRIRLPARTVRAAIAEGAAAPAPARRPAPPSPGRCEASTVSL